MREKGLFKFNSNFKFDTVLLQKKKQNKQCLGVEKKNNYYVDNEEWFFR